MSIDWKRVRPHLRELLELPESEHEAYLARIGGDDVELAETLRQLCAEDAADAAFLVSPFDESQSNQATLKASDEIGAWRVESLIGSGGMGEVWLAQRDDMGQRAAIKVVQRGLASPNVMERFERERRLLASLEHPNVARLVDGGNLPDGRPWLAMEYVDGVHLDAFCSEAGSESAHAFSSSWAYSRASAPPTASSSCTATSSRRMCSSRAIKMGRKLGLME